MSSNAWLGGFGAVLACLFLAACSSGLPPEKTDASRDTASSSDAGAGWDEDGDDAGDASGDGAGEQDEGDAGAAGEEGTGENDEDGTTEPPSPGSNSPRDAGGSAELDADEPDEKWPDGGAPHSSADAAVEPGLRRGPGARGGGPDYAPSVACDDLSDAYVDGLTWTGLVPNAPTIDPSSTCGPDTLYEPNDVAGQACRIALGQPVESEFSSATDTEDYFSVDVAKGVTYTLDLVREGAIRREVKLPVGTGESELVSDGLSLPTSEHLQFTPQVSGSARVHLSSGRKYKFTVLPSTDAGLRHDALTYEPNNSPATAAPICVGVPVAAEFTPPTDDLDHYSVNVVGGVIYTLDLEAKGPINGGVTMNVDNNILEPVTLDSAYRVFHKEFTFARSGRALVKLSGAAHDFVILPSTEGGLVHDPVTFEPNNSRSTYAPIEVGESVSSELSSSRDNIDCFGVPVEAGATYEIALARDRDLDLEVSMSVGNASQTPFPNKRLSLAGTSSEPFGVPADGIAIITLSGTGTKYTLTVLRI